MDADMSSEPKTPVRVGVFRRLSAADRAVHSLADAGFPTERISVICPESCQDVPPCNDPREHEDPAGAHLRNATLTGGAIGALLGGLAAGVGIAATGGVGLFVAGPLLGSAAGAGAVAGGFLGAMTTRGFEPEIADYYDQALSGGRILVAVDTEPGEGIPGPAQAERVFAECGAESLSLPEG